MKLFAYDTVFEAINGLMERGYTTDFKILGEKESSGYNKINKQLSPEDFKIDETYRFDGETDPGDEMIVYAISAIKNDIKGHVVNAYGMYSDSETSKIVSRLKKHVTTNSPIKRNQFIQPISREHHHGLLLCWKIKEGLKKNIELTRIKKYADWFYKNHLIPHFELEEKTIYTFLNNENEWVKNAISDHRKLTSLFESEVSEDNLQQIVELLQKHIRFEERILFNEIQKIATEAQLKSIADIHTEEKFEDNLTDAFWL